MPLPYLFVFPVVYDARLRFGRRKFDRLVQQNFVINDPFVLNAAVGADDHLRLAQKIARQRQRRRVSVTLNKAVRLTL